MSLDAPTMRAHVLTKRQYQIIDQLIMGFTPREIADMSGVKPQTIRASIIRAATKIIDVKVHRRKEVFREKMIRCVVWRSKQLGVIEHYAGLRDQWGVRLEEYEIPIFLPIHPLHEMLFPNRRVGR